MKATIQLSPTIIQPPPEPRDLLTEREACAYLKTSKRNLFCWRMSGLIPYIKIGRAVRFRAADVEQALQSMTITTKP